MKFDMFPGYVAVEKIEPDEKTPGGLFIPKNVTDGPLVLGRVVAAAKWYMSGSKDVEISLHEGDVVIYPWKSASWIEINGTEYTMLDYRAIVGRVENNESESTAVRQKG